MVGNLNRAAEAGTRGGRNSVCKRELKRWWMAWINRECGPLSHAAPAEQTTNHSWPTGVQRIRWGGEGVSDQKAKQGQVEQPNGLPRLLSGRDRERQRSIDETDRRDMSNLRAASGQWHQSFHAGGRLITANMRHDVKNNQKGR